MYVVTFIFHLHYVADNFIRSELKQTNKKQWKFGGGEAWTSKLVVCNPVLLATWPYNQLKEQVSTFRVNQVDVWMKRDFQY